jgi:DNA adenine methylase
MFSYIGGKNIIGDWISKFIPKYTFKRYSEVFGGAMWVFIKQNITAKEVYYNDFNPFLYNLWTSIIYKNEKLCEYLYSIYDKEKLDGWEWSKGLDYRKKFYAFKYLNFNNKSILQRAMDNESDAETAAVMVYQLTHSFSGNIQNCGCENPKSNSVKEYRRLVDRIDGVGYHLEKAKLIDGFYNLDFSEFIDLMDIEGGFFYVDPPYWKVGDLYYTKDFGKDQHHKLSEKLKNCKSFWILSYYPNDKIEDIYPQKDFVWYEKKFPKTASWTPDQEFKEKGVELLIMPRDQEKKIKEYYLRFLKW